MWSKRLILTKNKDCKYKDYTFEEPQSDLLAWKEGARHENA